VSDDRLRVAWHESAHAAVAFIFGRRVEVVSIRPTMQWGGVVFSRPTKVHDDEAESLGAPVMFLPARLRRDIEQDVVMTLAGDLGEELRFGRRSGYGLTKDETVADEVVRELALSAKQRAMLALGDEPAAAGDDDWSMAVRMTAALTSELEATAYLGFLRAAARAVVFSPQCVRLVEALVPVLLERDVVGGGEVRAVFRAAERAS
jgi:ATP-dependent Zn protease